MSRTIRRKGWHVVTSNKWTNQLNNRFAYIQWYKYWEAPDQERIDKHMKSRIEYNEGAPERNEELASRRHRDTFWKTERWSRYVSPVPRVFHKMEIKNSLRNDTDYNWDEKAARKYEKGVAQMDWD